MVLIIHHHVLKLISILITLCTLSDCYDPLDPNGNISVTFDIYQSTDNGYLARVTVQNNYLYRHVDKPGWKLGWTWANNEVIWSMNGAFATDRGNCLGYSGSQIPHSCKKDPTIVDLTPQVSQNRSENCCRGGLLSAWAIDPLNSFSSFELEVRNLGENPLGQPPTNLTLMAPRPWPGDPSLPQSNEDNIIECSDHMCPIRVHWHFKNNYMDHWRVKLTISNYNYKEKLLRLERIGSTILVSAKKQQLTASTALNFQPLGSKMEFALFWGIDFYNSELLHSDKGRQGVVTTEILLEKDPNSFTLRNGWAFPRRIYFNGEDCEMPLPDTFPMLPNGFVVSSTHLPQF
ncbi:COBRA, plant [Sesbania bispinosa]|nr:COBRA, plant [Sesbania bispinosa]